MMLWIVFCTILVVFVSEALIRAGYGAVFAAKVAGWSMLAALISTFVPSIIPGLDGRGGAPMVTYSKVSAVEPILSVNTESHDDEKSIIESCISPIPVAKQYSEGCGGGCVSLGFETPRTCNYQGPHDCIGTIKQKVTRYTLSPDYLNYKQHQIDDAYSPPEFIWPLQGRIIQVFSAGKNDGINISIPEGTEVKAVEGGEVAYADHELADYGDMVLIRHLDGFVSVYANNSELMVQKGDKVKRGQVIAKSGKSGKADLPQLHFELRKGSTPVNPILFLANL